jgi:hypothetical protein
MKQQEERKKTLHVAQAKSAPVSKDTGWMMIMQQIVKNKKSGEKHREDGEMTNKWQLLRMKHRYGEKIVYNAD